MNIAQSAILWWQRRMEVAALKREVQDLKEEVAYLRRERDEDREELRRVNRRLDTLVDRALGVDLPPQEVEPQNQPPPRD